MAGENNEENTASSFNHAPLRMSDVSQTKDEAG